MQSQVLVVVVFEQFPITSDKDGVVSRVPQSVISNSWEWQSAVEF